MKGFTLAESEELQYDFRKILEGFSYECKTEAKKDIVISMNEIVEITVKRVKIKTL